MHVEDQDILLEIGDKIKKFYSPEKNLEDNKLAGVQVNILHDIHFTRKKLLLFLVSFNSRF